MKYLDISKHIEECYKNHGDNCKGVDWPNEQDTWKRYQVMLELLAFDTHNKPGDKPSVLDFGCGLGHMYDYIQKNEMDIAYSGLDISEVFYQKCCEKYPSVQFYRADLLEDNVPDIPNHDYIIMNGVFTEKLGLSFDEMLEYFKKLVKKAYRYCDCGMAFNVMSKDVDWEREDLFHLPLNVLSGFLTKEVTRDFIVRYDYGLYEYTVYVYKRS